MTPENGILKPALRHYRYTSVEVWIWVRSQIRNVSSERSLSDCSYLSSPYRPIVFDNGKIFYSASLLSSSWWWWCLWLQLDTEAACLLTELQQQLNVVLDELCSAFATRSHRCTVYQPTCLIKFTLNSLVYCTGTVMFRYDYLRTFIFHVYVGISMLKPHEYGTRLTRFP